MKKVSFFAAVLSVLAISGVQAQDRPAVHGMLVVGKNHIYLSHLPMFHNPHNYQGVVEAKLPASAQAIYLKDIAAHPDQKVYTLVPEPFVLSDMMAHPKPFHADLFRGHFERGGVVIAQGITVQIAQVIYFKKFDPAATHPSMLQYLVFGDASEQFIAHVITAAPDFDQVLEVSGLPAGVLPRIVQFGDVAAEQPLRESASRREIYLETGDLAD